MKGSALGVTIVALLVGGCSSSGGNKPAELKDVAEACARITGCFAMTMDTCASVALGRQGYSQEADKLGECVKAGKDCDAVGRCLNAGQATTTCDSSTDGRRCDGTVRRACVGGVWVGVDCAPLGLECIQDSVGQLWCGTSDPCADSECHGDGVVSCVNKVMAYRSCGGGACVDSGGTKVCQGEGADCQTGDFRCEGNTAVTCLNGKEHREECAVCSDVDGAFCTTDKQCERSSCDGATLKACVDGVSIDSDCVSHGFSSCTEDASGAHCVP